MTKARYHDPEIQAIADQWDAEVRAYEASPAGKLKRALEAFGWGAVAVGLGVLGVVFASEIYEWTLIGAGLGALGMCALCVSLFL